MRWLGSALAVVATTLSAGCSPTTHTPDAGGLPISAVGEIELSGGPVRFDYASIDPSRGLMFLAHMGAGQLVEVDLHAGAVLRTIGDLPDVHGVIVVPDRHRVYATATGQNQVVAFDEDTGARLFAASTGTYPDGLAYDPVHDTVWTTNERGGTETVVDADTGTVRGTVDLGGEVGNVVYDLATATMIVAVQGRDELAVIDPVSLTVTRRIPTPECEGPHGQALDNVAQVMFVGCEHNATMVSVDLKAGTVTDHQTVGETPDVLVYDAELHRIYLAAESGWVSVFDHHEGRTTVLGSMMLADGAHTLALDPLTHHTYFPLPHGPGDRPVLREYVPSD